MGRVAGALYEPAEVAAAGLGAGLSSSDEGFINPTNRQDISSKSLGSNWSTEEGGIAQIVEINWAQASYSTTIPPGTTRFGEPQTRSSLTVGDRNTSSDRVSLCAVIGVFNLKISATF